MTNMMIAAVAALATAATAAMNNAVMGKIPYNNVWAEGADPLRRRRAIARRLVRQGASRAEAMKWAILAQRAGAY